MFNLEMQYLKYAKKLHPLQSFKFRIKNILVDNLKSNGNFTLEQTL